MNLALEDDSWKVAIEDASIVEYDNYVYGFTPFDLDGTGYVIDTLRVFISLDKKTSRIGISVYPWKEGETYTSYEDAIKDEWKKNVEGLVEGTAFYQQLIKEKGVKNMNRYFVVTNKNSDYHYGWIYKLSSVHKDEFVDFYELENPLHDEGIVTMPTEDVTEIFEEEYKLVLKYAEQNIATNELVKQIITNHQVLKNKTEREKEMEQKVFFTFSFVGEQMDVEQFIRELGPYAQGDIHKRNKIHLDKETYNPMIHLEVKTWVYAKDMMNVLKLEKETELHTKVEYSFH